MSTVELRFAALAGHVRTARMIATTVSRRAGVPDEAVDEIKLAVGEACARAVRVNQRIAPEELVRVRLVDSSETFVVAVSDLGSSGDGVPTPRSLLDPADMAGLAPDIGLALIEGLVDEMQISPGENGVGTVVTMCWRTEPKPDDMAGMSGPPPQII